MLAPAELEALLTSLAVAARALTVALPLAIVAAWLLARPATPGRFLHNAVVPAPMVLPPASFMQTPAGKAMKDDLSPSLVACPAQECAPAAQSFLAAAAKS